MKFIYYVRTPLPPFHWVLSLSRGWSKFYPVLKYYPFCEKGQDDLPEYFSADQTASTKHDPSLLVRHPLDPATKSRHHVIQATACHKYFVTFDNVALVKSIVQYTPPLLNDPKSALHVLANALNVRRDIPLW